MPESRADRILFAIQPACLVVSSVFAMATEIVSTPEALLRPIAVAVALSTVVVALSFGLTRNWPITALLASGFVLFGIRETLPGLLLLVLGGWWLLVRLLRRRRQRRDPSAAVPRFVARAVGIFSVALLGISGWTLASAYAAGQPVWRVPEYEATGSGGPNIYMILVDGYPRADTLASTFGFDNEPFLEQLESLGFKTSNHARANYNKTWLTFASMFNGAYIDQVVEDSDIPTDNSLQIRWLMGMIERAALLDVFRERGYIIRTVPSPFTSTTLASADQVIDVGALSELEVRLISKSPWSQFLRASVLAWFGGTQAGVVHRAIEITAELAEQESSKPQLVFTHVHSPHTPFVLHPEGASPVPAPDCQPTFCAYWNATIEELGAEVEEFGDGLKLQVEELNRVLAAGLERIVAADPNAIVIVMSDHGIRYSLSDLDEHYRIFMAARTPGTERLFPVDESPTNVIRRTLGALGEDIEVLPYERWNGDWFRYLELRPANGPEEAGQEP